MPKPKRARRFEPRYGVNRVAIDAEAEYLAREVSDYLVYSLNDLSGKLQERRSAWQQADASVKDLVLRLPERERLVVECLLVRDFHHMLELYLTHLRSHEPAGPAPLKPADRPDAPVTPFSEWLFGPE